MTIQRSLNTVVTETLDCRKTVKHRILRPETSVSRLSPSERTLSSSVNRRPSVLSPSRTNNPSHDSPGGPRPGTRLRRISCLSVHERLLCVPVTRTDCFRPRFDTSTRDSRPWPVLAQDVLVFPLTPPGPGLEGAETEGRGDWKKGNPYTVPETRVLK